MLPYANISYVRTMYVKSTNEQKILVIEEKNKFATKLKCCFKKNIKDIFFERNVAFFPLEIFEEDISKNAADYFNCKNE